MQARHAATCSSHGKDVTGARRAASCRDVRRSMGFLFQNAALFDSITVGENVAFPLRRHTDWPDREDPQVARSKARGRRPRGRLRQDAGGAFRRHAEARRASPARWRSTRTSCSSTSRAPGSIRSPLDEIDQLLVDLKTKRHDARGRHAQHPERAAHRRRAGDAARWACDRTRDRRGARSKRKRAGSRVHES